MSYPVLKVIGELQEKLLTHPVVILQAPPGAGKSTAIPLEIMSEPWLENKKIVMLEPRRLAARSVAMRMSAMLREETGDRVGYRVRFDTRVSSKTKIEVVTEGILTRMIQQDNAISEIGLVIFDEFHERSLHADLSLALCLQVQQVLRPDLRILIMSATFDAVKLSSVVQAPVITSTGKLHPVVINYFPPDSNQPYWNALHTIRAIRKALHENFGDVLVFLPGAGEIRRTAGLLQEIESDVIVHALYGDLSYKKQQEAILPDPGGRRKIILATSIAETSLTIEGIGIVIDTGYSRVPRFNPRSGFTRLETIRVTKDSADQRAGRAGRLGPGVCYRLWSEGINRNLLPERLPEILEADLAALLLELKAWGIDDPSSLTWITEPPAGALNQANDLLHRLKALKHGKITPTGRAMLRLPAHPRIAHMLIEASSSSESTADSLAADIAAILEERDPMQKEHGTDIGVRVEVLRKWRKGDRVDADNGILERIETLAASWRRILKVQTDNSFPAEGLIGKILLAAYPERIGKLVDKNANRYKLANGRTARLPDSDPLSKETWIIIPDLDEGTGDGKIFSAASVNMQDLEIISEERAVVKWDNEKEMITAALEKRVGNLTVSSTSLSSLPNEVRIAELVNVVRERGLKVFDWKDFHTAWQSRVLSLRKWRPEELWPDVSEKNLLDTANSWLPAFLTNVWKSNDFAKVDVTVMLASLLPWELQSRLDALAPPGIAVPSGSRIRIQYSPEGEAPVMEVRLQEVFGMTNTPTVNEGRTRVVLHLLSPGYKPVQVTQDLKSFWSTTYAEVRKELRSRYPKHSWPEDPWTAEAVRGARKRSS